MVRLPRALLDYTNGEEDVEVSAATLAEAFTRLNQRYPGLGERILDDQGAVRPYVHIFVNEDSVGHGAPEEKELRSGDRVTILPSVAGGFHG